MIARLNIFQRLSLFIVHCLFVIILNMIDIKLFKVNALRKIAILLTHTEQKIKIYNDSSIWAWRKTHTQNNIDINKMKKSITSNHNFTTFLSVQWNKKEKSTFKIQSGFSIFCMSPRQTHKLNKFKSQICKIGYSYIFKRMLFLSSKTQGVSCFLLDKYENKSN